MALSATAHLHLSQFGASEVARISGVSLEKQRDWRRRGLLDSLPSSSHARFDSFELARLMVWQVFSDVGVDLRESRSLADWAAVAVLNRALEGPRAVEVEPAIGSEEAEARLRPHRTGDRHRYLAAFHPLDRTTIADDDLRRVLEANAAEYGRVVPFEAVGDVAAFAEILQPTGNAIAWSVVDLQAIAQRLALVAGVPLAHITSSKEPPRKRKAALRADELNGLRAGGGE